METGNDPSNDICREAEQETEGTISDESDFEDALDNLNLESDKLKKYMDRFELPPENPFFSPVGNNSDAGEFNTSSYKSMSDDKSKHFEKSDSNTSDSNDLSCDTEQLENPDGEQQETLEETDTIDEDALKVLEDTLSPEEKEERKKKADDIKAAGNALFKEKNFEDASDMYTQALQICPLCYIKERSIMYANRAACKQKLERPEPAIIDCTKALDLHPHYLKARLRRAELYEVSDKLDEALADYQKAVEMDPTQHAARAACMRLPDQIKEGNEKLKEEMFGKLKDLGNLVLKPFGLSTENFKLQQDPNTGGYSVQFKQ